MSISVTTCQLNRATDVGYCKHPHSIHEHVTTCQTGVDMMPATPFLLESGQEFPKNFEPILEHRLRLVAEKSSFPQVHIPLDETRIAYQRMRHPLHKLCCTSGSTSARHGKHAFTMRRSLLASNTHSASVNRILLSSLFLSNR